MFIRASMLKRTHGRMIVLGSLLLTLSSAPFIGAQDAPPVRPAQPPPVRPADAAPARPARVPDTVQEMLNIRYATVTINEGETEKDLLLDAYFPKQAGDERMPAIIYIHGGGYVAGAREMGRSFCAGLAQGGYFAVTISYRFAQETPLPAAMEDCKAAVRFLRANAEELGIDPDRIGVWGHSAGGHLAAFLAVTGNAPDTHGAVGTVGVSSAVTCAVNFFGPADFTTMPLREINLSLERLFGPGDIDGAVKAAGLPVHVDRDDPPILIIHGSADPIVPFSQSALLAKALDEAGVMHELIRVEGAGHNVTDPGVILRAMAFFDEHLGGRAAEVVRALMPNPPPQTAPGRAPTAEPPRRPAPPPGRGGNGAG